MATLADSGAQPQPAPVGVRRDRFFLYTNTFITVVMVAGFSLHVVLGRSSFNAPAIVHAHALIFFSWVTLYFTQTVLVSAGAVRIHRTLGLASLALVPAMVVMGCAITWFVVHENRAPPFFEAREFLFGNIIGILLFAALALTAVAKRGQSAWHKRLMFCAMASITGPGFGRILPAPLMIPVAWTVFAFVIPLLLIGAGMIADKRRDGRIHPAYLWGAAAIAVTHLVSQGIAFSPVGESVTRSIIAGTPDADRSFAPRFPGPPPS